MTEEDIKKIEAINESPNPPLTLFANLMWAAQRQQILALNNLCDGADAMMGKSQETQAEQEYHG